jgi:hypothetical protein
VYAYHQNCYEAHERIKRREREAESERIRRGIRAQRQKRRRAALLDLLIARRRSTGLELDT